MGLLSRHRAPRRETVVFRSGRLEHDVRRADEQRRDWMAQAGRAQDHVVRLTLLVTGGAMVAIMTLIGIVIQARLPVDLKPVSDPLGYLAAALLVLLTGDAIRAGVLGGIALFALDPDSDATALAKRQEWAATAYWLSWAVWMAAMVLVIIALDDARRVMPSLFAAIQSSLAPA